ncbi:uncharacterized protein FOBCDRAFT_139764, partial [Fusarium oxysporum Fo47]|uniref:uncharacterized protein n=1 Tax=Fusarium oxysporum Fo47 TaxID=660027 RepID=UPI0028699215
GHDFDVEYYVKNHMPLAKKIWRLGGLKSYGVIKLGGESPYQIYSMLQWDSLASFEKAFTSEEGKAIQDDVKNFTTAIPIIVVGGTVAQG